MKGGILDSSRHSHSMASPVQRAGVKRQRDGDGDAGGGDGGDGGGGGDTKRVRKTIHRVVPAHCRLNLDSDVERAAIARKARKNGRKWRNLIFNEGDAGRLLGQELNVCWHPVGVYNWVLDRPWPPGGQHLFFTQLAKMKFENDEGIGNPWILQLNFFRTIDDMRRWVMAMMKMFSGVGAHDRALFWTFVDTVQTRYAEVLAKDVAGASADRREWASRWEAGGGGRINFFPVDAEGRPVWGKDELGQIVPPWPVDKRTKWASTGSGGNHLVTIWRE